MHNKLKPTVLVVMGLAWLPMLSVPAARADDNYPTQGSQGFNSDGVVTMVDADRDRVTIKTSDGTQYNLDTDDTNIKLHDTARPGDTADLVTGMHVHVTGKLLSQDIVAADHLTVLSIDSSNNEGDSGSSDQPEEAPAPPPSEDNGPPPPAEAPEPAPAPNPPAVSGHGQRIRLRGTVENVDDDTGTVVVRVNSHMRTVVVNHDTDLTDIPSIDDNHIGLHTGDRITVVGLLTPDGTVKARAISLSKDIQSAERASGQGQDMAPPTDTPDPGQYMAPPIDSPDEGRYMAPPIDTPNQLVGRVSDTSSFSRDIGVRLDNGRVVTIHVPHEARVLRNGVPISMHDLTGDDIIRVVGGYDPDDHEFKASRIEVLRIYQEQ